jgi:hypothetical protein
MQRPLNVFVYDSDESNWHSRDESGLVALMQWNQGFLAFCGAECFPEKLSGKASKEGPTGRFHCKSGRKKSKHYKPKVLARQRNNYRYGNALGYAQEYGYGPRGPFF